VFRQPLPPPTVHAPPNTESTRTSRRAGSTQDSVAQRAQLVTETAPAAWVLEPSEIAF